jgi:hypothetical protein
MSSDMPRRLAMDCVADLAEIGEARERVHGDGARDIDAEK